MRRFTRRDFLKMSLVAGGAAMLNACKPKATAVPTTAAAALDLPFEIDPDAVNPLQMPEPVTAEGVSFSGGFGHDYIQFAADLFAKVHPGSQVTVEPI